VPLARFGTCSRALQSAGLWTTIVTLTFCLSASTRAQENVPSSPAQPNPVAPPATGPTAALRGILAAACAHNEQDFAKFLTARNRDSFSRLTAAARVSLMKRLVLLDDAGKPTISANPAGRPIVRCETPIGAAEIQLGGADVQQNLAFLPVELRDATDAAGAGTMHVQIGLVREGTDWKLLSVGLVLLDLPSLEVEWDTAEIGDNEHAAIRDLKFIGQQIEAYRRTYARLPNSLAALGPPVHGGATPDAAGLLESDLATGSRNGYNFRYVIVGAETVGAPAHFEVSAVPANYGRTGKRSFFRDVDGGLHGADHQGAVGSPTDPRVE
jgi:hypothetical protein